MHESPSAKEATAIKIEDPTILRPDFYQTTKAGGERQRLALACQTCRQKKVKCNGELPKCQRCRNLALECEYKLTTHRRSRNSTGGKPRTEANGGDEVRPLHESLHNGREDWRPHQPPPPPTMGSAPKRPRTGTASPSMDDSRRNEAKLPKLTAPSNTQEPVNPYPRSSASLYSASQASRYTYPATNGFPDTTIRYELPSPLPSHRLVIELCQVYFSRIYGQMYSFLHPPSFMRTVVERPQLIAPSLLLAICALSARFHLAASPETLQPDLWATSCLDMILGTGAARTGTLDPTTSMPNPRMRFFRPSVSSIQALHLVAYHYFGEGQSSCAWLIAGFALRMAEALHLNREVHDDPIGRSDDPALDQIVSFRYREMRRRTYWALFLMDRLSSAGVHRPFSIKNEDVAIQLPVKQESYDREILSFTGPLIPPMHHEQQHLSASMDCSAYMIRIIDVWGEVSRFVQQSASELNWNTGSPLMSLRQKILMWEEGLPHYMKYTSSNVRQQTPAWYIMHAAYFLCLCVMHRFALPKSETRQYGIDHIPVAYLNMCVKEAILNASRVSEIIQMIPSSIKLSAPFMGFAAFSAATLHAFLGFHVPEMDPLLISAHRGYVHSTLTFLSTLAEAWKPLSKMHDALTSQVNNRPRSDRSTRSSILNESHANQFKVPDSLPVKFTTQQQIEMNTLAFSNWFDDPVTAAKLNHSWDSSHLVPPYASHQGISYAAEHQLLDMMARSTSNPESRTRVKTPSASDAPYGEAFPIVNADESDNDDVVADLLVSFKQADQPEHARHGHQMSNNNKNGKNNNNNNSKTAGERRAITQEAVVEEEYLDHLNSLRETTSAASATIDCLQLMKVGVITIANWT